MESASFVRLSVARVGRLATTGPDGRPHIVPCCFVLDGDVLYSAIDAKPKTSLRLRRISNIRTNPFAALLVDNYEEDWSLLWWIRVDGGARVLETGAEFEGAIDRLVDKYDQYQADRPTGPVIAIDIVSVRTWSSTLP